MKVMGESQTRWLRKFSRAYEKKTGKKLTSHKPECALRALTDMPAVRWLDSVEEGVRTAGPRIGDENKIEANIEQS
jgi:hypothetical protein